jgi:hypothetical protein
MKSRFVGVITVRFPDDYVEKCLVKERADKGKEHFLKTVSEYADLILNATPKGNVKLIYKGDFAPFIYDALRKAQDGKTEKQQNPKTVLKQLPL